jgi:alpha-beta hydrolase superfamily lysophospholipase
MAEHGFRYDRLARRLAAGGIEVWAADQRGHGKTADPGVNDPGRGGLLGHAGDREGFNRVTADIDGINRSVRRERPGKPLILMGHSWGSFIVQNYLETFASPMGGDRGIIDGAVLSGTRGPGGAFTVGFGAALSAFLARVQGPRRAARVMWNILDKPRNRPFRPNRTAVDWLSRDTAEVDAYAADPLCGQLCSIGFYRDMIGALARIHKQEALKKINPDLPIYIFSGARDPVGEMGEGPTNLVSAYKSLEVKDVEFVLYPDARHEALNETNREEVTENLLSWLLRHWGP